MSQFEVIIQAGALLAVVALYRDRVAALMSGLIKPRSAGRALLIRLTVAFLPAAALGLALHHRIEERLFGVRPVAAALLVGGVVMVVFERWRRRAAPSARIQSLEQLPLSVAIAV